MDPRLTWPELSFPPCGAQVRREAGRWQLRCAVRRKWVALEPEEWVRQHVVEALVGSGWPLSRMVLEHPVRFGRVDGRIDIACFDRSGRIALAVEVKAPHVKLDARVVDQVARYDLAVGAHWLMISNGLRSAVWQRDAEGQARQSKLWPVPSDA